MVYTIKWIKIIKTNNSFGRLKIFSLLFPDVSEGLLSKSNKHQNNLGEFSGKPDLPYFDKGASKNVTAPLGKTAYLNCRVKNLANRTVSIHKITWRFWILDMFHYCIGYKKGIWNNNENWKKYMFVVRRLHKPSIIIKLNWNVINDLVCTLKINVYNYSFN